MHQIVVYVTWFCGTPHIVHNQESIYKAKLAIKPGLINHYLHNHHFLQKKTSVSIQQNSSCYPFIWCVSVFDFAICLRTIRLEFSFFKVKLNTKCLFKYLLHVNKLPKCDITWTILFQFIQASLDLAYSRICICYAKLMIWLNDNRISLPEYWIVSNHDVQILCYEYTKGHDICLIISWWKN